MPHTSMNGTFFKLPSDTLHDAMSPIADSAAMLDWAISIQSGLFQFDRETPDLSRFVHRSVDDINGMTWLERGFLPNFANCLILDEWSYYLGFDSYRVSPQTVAQKLSNDLSPRPRLFNTIQQFGLVYIMRVDEGWWEAYTSNGTFLRQLRQGLNGSSLNSDRWDDGVPKHPGFNTVPR